MPIFKIMTDALDIANSALNRVLLHEEGCERKWIESKNELNRLQAKMDTLHEQNTAKLDENNEKLNKILNRIWMLIGMGMVIGAILTTPGRQLVHFLTQESYPITDSTSKK